MIRSMTGYGRAEKIDTERKLVCEIKAVNHRYLDVSVKLPRKYSFLEEALRAEVKKAASRGKIDVFVSVDELSTGDSELRLNAELAASYVSALKSIRLLMDPGKAEADLPSDASFIASREGVLTQSSKELDEEALTAFFASSAAEALERFNSMRETEGEKLAKDLLSRAETIDSLTAEIKKRAPLVGKEYALKLKARISELLEGSIEIPEERIMLEAALFSDKAAIDEEIVRLKSHTSQLRKIVSESREPAGKKLDFLVQEMNREANTIGSKSNDLEITSLMLELKAEIEKIREQVQNIE